MLQEALHEVESRSTFRDDCRNAATQFLAIVRVGRYFDILINRDISNRDYRIEAKNLSDDLSKLSSCSMNIVILLGNMYITCRIL